MQLDAAAKIASIASVVVGLVISIGGWYANRQIQASQEKMGVLLEEQKRTEIDKAKLENRKSQDAETARLTAELSAPLARTFAVQYKNFLDAKEDQRERYVLPPSIANEIKTMWPLWNDRIGLMTGDACASAGLLARQVVVLLIKNVGRVDAVDLTLTVLEKASPTSNPGNAWSHRPAGAAAPLAYDELATASDWAQRKISLPAVYGTQTPEADRKALKVVLASVSGRTTLYGTALVPVEISWSDKVTGTTQHQKLLEVQGPMLNAELAGAEIGRVTATCRKLTTAP